MCDAAVFSLLIIFMLYFLPPDRNNPQSDALTNGVGRPQPRTDPGRLERLTFRSFWKVTNVCWAS